MSEHPPAFVLEAASVGEMSAEVSAHLETCAVCRARIEALRAERQAFLQEESTEAFLSRPAIAAELNRPPASPRRRWWWIGGLIPVAALGLFLFLAPSSSKIEGVSNPNDVTLKGAQELAVVRLRDGAQSVETGPVPLKIGDQIRVRLTLAQPGPVTVGILEDDGTWTVLADTSLSAGVHYLPKDEALAVETPVSGWVVVGSEDEVKAALTENRMEDLGSCRLETDAP